jgi:hypothetical protein
LSTERPLKKRPRFTTDGSRPKEEREGTGAVKDLGEEGGAQYKLGLFTEEVYRIHNMPPENVSHQLKGTPQTHGMGEIYRTLRRARINTLKTPVPNGAGGYRLKVY